VLVGDMMCFVEDDEADVNSHVDIPVMKGVEEHLKRHVRNGSMLSISHTPGASRQRHDALVRVAKERGPSMNWALELRTREQPNTCDLLERMHRTEHNMKRTGVATNPSSTSFCCSHNMTVGAKNHAT
jgi:hypothetical protein